MKVAAVIRGCKQAISVIEVAKCGRIYIEKGMLIHFTRVSLEM